MEPLTGMLIMQGISTAASLFGGAAGGREAKKAARAEARAEGELTSHKIGQLLQEERILRGKTISATAASGVKTGTGRYGGAKGSPIEILDEMSKRFAEERAIVSRVGATKTSSALQRGSMVATQSYAQGVSQAASSLSNAFSLWSTHSSSSGN